MSHDTGARAIYLSIEISPLNLKLPMTAT
jgi:hypothetical protein